MEQVQRLDFRKYAWFSSLGFAFSMCAACHHQGLPAEHDVTSESIHGMESILLEQFASNPSVQGQVFSVSFEEAATRLGALRFEAQVQFLFSRGNDEVDQRDIYFAEQDAFGHRHVRLDTPHSQIEYYLLGETAYIRLDKGRLRNKPRRDMGHQAWAEIAFSSCRQLLQIFDNRLQFKQRDFEVSPARPTLRFDLSLSDKSTETGLSRIDMHTNELPYVPLAEWRNKAQPLDLQGELILDQATGVMLGAFFEGRLEIADRPVRPTELWVRYDAKISHIGKVPVIRPPQSIPEYTRKRQVRDRLSFFRDRLNQEEQKEKEKEEGLQKGNMDAKGLQQKNRPARKMPAKRSLVP